MDAAATTLRAGRVLLAHAPTGTGKTVSSLVATLEATVAGQTKILFVTNRRTQRAIAVKEARAVQAHANRRIRLTDLPSKQSLCTHPTISQETHFQAFVARCSAATRAGTCDAFTRFQEGTRPTVEDVAGAGAVRRASKAAGVCPYEVSSERARDADVAVLDYNHVFTDLWNPTVDRLGVDPKGVLLVVDEAHNLVDRTRDGSTYTLGPANLEEAYREARAARSPEIADYVKTIARRLKRLIDESGDPAPGGQRVAGDALEDDLVPGDRRSMIGNIMTLAAARRARHGEGVGLEILGRFLARWFAAEPQTRILSKDDGGWSLETGLIDPRRIIRERLLGVKAAILMSGTLYPTDLHRQSFGLAPEEVDEVTLESGFPPENRPVRYHDDLTSRWGSRGGAMYHRYARRILDVHRSVEGNVAAFFPSYRFQRDVHAAVAPEERELVLHEAAGMPDRMKQRLLDDLRRAQHEGGKVFLGVYGGSFSEGVDFDDNLLSAVLLCGLPLPPPSDKQKAIEEHYARRDGPAHARRMLSAGPAMTRAVQAAGRGIRSETDRCEVHFMDDRFAWAAHQALLPPDLRRVATP
jgi:DNA excision repair protein ERCC-2